MKSTNDTKSFLRRKFKLIIKATWTIIASTYAILIIIFGEIYNFVSFLMQKKKKK